MHLLLIEDHPTIAQNIIDYCQLQGHTVDWYASPVQVVSLLGKQYRDCAILDVMLPEIDGIQMLRKIRQYAGSLPVIMSTALGTIEEKSQAYDAGADDYLVKPYSLTELMMRTQAVVSRSQERDVVRLGDDCIVYLDENRVVVGDQAIHCSTKERVLLSTLVSHHGMTVTRTMLIEAIWGDDQTRGHDASLDVYIATLRKKLGKSLIQTVKGVGYKLSTEA